MATQYANGKIVTDGLVLCLNAADKNSYPGSGTTWTDISGNGNSGTLTNGPTYSTDSGGAITFDGIDDYIQFSSVSVQTVCFWGRMDSDIPNLAGLVCTSAGGDGSLRTEGGTFRAASPGAPDGNDFHVGYVSSFMINGVSNLSINASGYFIVPDGRSLTQNFYIGTIGNARNISTISHTFLGRVYKGKVFNVTLYNRQLSNTELLQNYNAQKSRFGLK